jgi:hypothetical protein
MTLDKRACLVRARSLLETLSLENTRYAALELRLCIEALTYEKLRSFSSVIPESVLATWQPPQAVKALLEFEPLADQSFKLSAGIEDTPGVKSKNMRLLGEHKSLQKTWLRKHYNKLGSLLHSPMVTASQSTGVEDTIKYLNEVIADLEGPVSSNIIGGGLRTVFKFVCTQCNKLSICNKDAVINNKRAVCLNPQCGAEYFATVIDKNKAKFELMATPFECTYCKATTSIENRKLDFGYTFNCAACEKKHRIENREWQYDAVKT